MTKQKHNELSHEYYGKNYNELPDDGIEQDFIQGEFEKQDAEKLELINGNHQKYEIGLPKIVIIQGGKWNDVAKQHLKENTGLDFEDGKWDNLIAKPTNSQQIVKLLLTYNFKSRYYNNSTFHNELHLKDDHHVGFDIECICLDCVKKNHLNSNGLKAGDYLSC